MNKMRLDDLAEEKFFFPHSFISLSIKILLISL